MADRKELVEAFSTSVQGLGRTRAETLYDAGFTSLEKLVSATRKELLAVEGIGPAMADRIIESATASHVEPEAEDVEPVETKPEAPVTEDKLPAEKKEGVVDGTTGVEAEEAEKEGAIRRLFKGKRKDTEEEKEKEKRQARIKKKERADVKKPAITIGLSPEEERQMRVRSRQKYRKPEFNKHDSHKKKRVSSSWRKPQGQHNKQRHHFASKGKLVQAGFGAPAKVRGKHPSGFDEVLICTPDELENVEPTQAVRISGTVGLKKRLRIEVTCEQRGIRLLNPSNLFWGEEAKAADTDNDEPKSEK